METKAEETTETEFGGGRADWAELTHECLTNILSRLTFEDRWRGTMLVCKSWFRAFKDPSLHTTFNLDPQFDPPPELARWWTPDFERKIDSMLRSVVEWSDGALTEIRVRHCSDRSLAFVAERCKLGCKFGYPFASIAFVSRIMGRIVTAWMIVFSTLFFRYFVVGSSNFGSLHCSVWI